MKKQPLLFILLVILSMHSRAQLCNGSLGDPVAWISFGEGSSASQPLPASRTNYTFTGSSCPDDGEYTLGNLSFGCFNQTWHTLVGDHTPDDAGGKYMLVNASSTPGIFYQDTVNGLCGSTTYELSAFVVNMLKPGSCPNNGGIDPNLTFTIQTLNGTELVSYNSGDIGETDAPMWRQYGTFFQTPANVGSVIIRIRNNAPGGCGNDLALDDITFRPCGPRINAVLAVNNSNFIGICEGDARSFQLSATYTAGYANPRLQWQISTDNGRNWNDIPGATSANYLRAPTGRGYFQYRLLIADGANINNPVCRIASQPVTVQVTPPPFIQATNYVFSCYGSTVNLFASGGSTYRWTGPNGFQSTLQGPSLPNIQFNQAGLYTVVVTTAFGCTASTSTDLVVYPAVTLTRSPDQDICEGQSVQLNAGGGTQYRWEPGTGLNNQEIPNPVASPRDSTIYKLIVVNDAGCFDTALVRVNVWKKPVANAGPDLRTITGYPVQLQGSARGTDIRFAWSPVIDMTNMNSLRPTVTLNATTFPQVFTYRLDVSSNRGCGSASDEATVTVYETVKVPNTFTPNGDGYNDTWEIELLRIFPEAVVEVYNTAGSIVYRSVTYQQPWDGTRNGKPLPAGTYYYTIDLKVQNSKRLAGYVTIIR
jgi:gliding motility-associated-like protein